MFTDRNKSDRFKNIGKKPNNGERDFNIIDEVDIEKEKEESTTPNWKEQTKIVKKAINLKEA